MLLESVRNVFDMIDADITFAVENKNRAFDINDRFLHSDYKAVESMLRRVLVDVNDAEKKLSGMFDKI